MSETYLDFLYIRCKESQTGEGSRTDCKALSCCGSSVSKSIKNVCTLAHLRVKLAHLGITAGIVSDRAVCVCCKGDTECRKHTHSGDTDTVKTCTEAVCRE